MKEIIFVIDSITCGGAERALTALLKALDYSKYSVDLLYFCRENEYYKADIPPQVNILNPDAGTELALSSKNFVLANLNQKQYWDIIFKRIWFGIMGRLYPKNYFRRRIKDWKRLKKHIAEQEKRYDAAIAYLEGNSVYYTLDKIKAKRYIVWQRTDYRLTGCCSKWEYPYFKRADFVCVLSNEMKVNFIKEFPLLSNKTVVFPNIIDVQNILQKSKIEVEYDDEFTGLRIISIGTLRHVKGYDVAMRACRILVKRGYNFRWYILGFGEERGKIEREIKRLELEQHFFLLGNKKNPYAYLARSDIFVQCSYREGFSTTVFEAKCLQKPIVITDAPGMSNQIEHGVNGWIVPVGNAEKVAEAISQLLDSEDTCRRFSKALKKDLEKAQDNIRKKIELFDTIVG